jgi:hypothetical protein
MASLIDLYAQSTEYGALGGYRKAKEDQRTQETHDVATEGKKIANKQASEKLDDYVAERSMRRKAQQVKEQEYDRISANKDALDEAYVANIDNTIAKLASSTHSHVAEMSANLLGGVKDQQTFDMAVEQAGGAEQFQQMTGIDPTIPYKQNKNAVKYAIRVGKDTAAHMRAKEIQMMGDLAAYRKAMAGGKGGGTPQKYDAVKVDEFVPEMNVDGFWGSIFGGGLGKEDALQSEAAYQISQEMATITNSYMQGWLNEAKYYKTMPRGTTEDAKQRARYQVKAMWHKVNSDGEVVAMDPEEYNQMMARETALWQTNLEARMGGNAYARMDADERNARIREKIIEQRKAEYDAAMSRQVNSVR